MKGTLLAEARGHFRGFLSQGDRRYEMQPISSDAIGCQGKDRTRYLIEVATFKLSNFMLDEAAQLTREAMQIELRRYFVGVFDKPSSPICEITDMAGKLRSRMIISREDLRFFRDVATLGGNSGLPAIEQALEAVAKLLGS